MKRRRLLRCVPEEGALAERCEADAVLREAEAAGFAALDGLSVLLDDVVSKIIILLSLK